MELRILKYLKYLCVTAFAFGASAAAGDGQLIHSGESAYVIEVKGGEGVTFNGSYLLIGSDGGSQETKIKGTVPAKFAMIGTNVFLTLQNESAGGEIEMRVGPDGNRELDKDSPLAQIAKFLEVSISKNGTTVKKLRTDAPHGVVSLASTMPVSGLPRQTELVVDGASKFAFLTFTSETGDIKQELVPIPFSKQFFPREGWIVGLSAQKVKVTRLDPFDIRRQRVLVLDDGKSGSVHVSIREISGLGKEAATSEAFGVASVTVPIK